MTTYAIGEVQGGYPALLELLETIQFDELQDELWFSGDLVNMHGSLELLRYLKGLGKNAKIVLGDAEIKLLTVAEGFVQAEPNDGFDEILNAPDRDELLKWLRQCPFMHYDERLNFALVHAGIPAEWSLSQARTFAIEVESALSFGGHKAFLENMLKNPPRRWNAKLRGWKRLQFIVNAFTRMCSSNEKGYMDFGVKTPATRAQADEYIPWYRVENRATAGINIIFGHCSARDDVAVKNIYPLKIGHMADGPLSVLKLPSFPA